MKRFVRQFGCFALSCIAWIAGWNVACATDFVVSSASEIATAMQTAQPGDTLIMTNGTWTNQQIQFAGDGATNNPITLRAETPGQVILNGNSTINISGDWLVVDGLNVSKVAHRWLGRVTSSSFAAATARRPIRDSPTRQSSTTTLPTSTRAISGSRCTVKTIASTTIALRARTIRV